MRSAVCALNAAQGDNFNMNFPDYEQSTAHHSCLLVLIRGIGVICIILNNLEPPINFVYSNQPNKPRTLQKIFERIQKINNVKIKGLHNPDSC